MGNLCTVGLNMSETLQNMLAQAKLFLVPISISELTTSQNFFGAVWPPSGATTTFTKNWNFDLKIFFGESFQGKNELYGISEQFFPQKWF